MQSFPFNWMLIIAWRVFAYVHQISWHQPDVAECRWNRYESKFQSKNWADKVWVEEKESYFLCLKPLLSCNVNSANQGHKVRRYSSSIWFFKPVCIERLHLTAYGIVEASKLLFRKIHFFRKKIYYWRRLEELHYKNFFDENSASLLDELIFQILYTK